MNILAVDDSEIVLNTLVKALDEVLPSAKIYSYTDPLVAYSDIKNKCSDLYIAFLDIEMYTMNGVQLAAELKKLFPRVYIVFVTAFSEYTMDAFKVHANGYLLKPVTAEKLKEEISAITSPFEQEAGYRIDIHTFGNFEVFVDNEPVRFSRSKAKELLAVLVDRKGAGMTTAQIAAVLWENKEYNRSLKNQVQTIIKDLVDSLTEVNAADIIIRQWNSLSVDKTKFHCDYYEFIKGNVSAINSFTGEYMTNYSWAEFTTGYLYGKANPKENK